MAGDTEYRQLWLESLWPELARSGATAAPDYIQPVLIAIGAEKGWVRERQGVLAWDVSAFHVRRKFGIGTPRKFA